MVYSALTLICKINLQDLILRICHYYMNWMGFSGFTITQNILKDVNYKTDP